MTTEGPTDDALLHRFHSIAVAFAFAVARAREAAGLEPLTGVLAFVVDGDPFRQALTVDGIEVAERDGDPDLAPLAAEIVTRGLSRCPDSTRRGAVELLERRAGVMSLMIPLGQDTTSVYGVLSVVVAAPPRASNTSGRPTLGERSLFVLHGGEQSATVN